MQGGLPRSYNSLRVKFFTRKTGLLVAALFVVAAAIHFATPSVWRWSGNNLQVQIHRKLPTDGTAASGTYGKSFGWSKTDFFTFQWWRGGSSESGGGLKEEIQGRITGASPGGVWVKVTCHNAASVSGPISFDTIIFVPVESTSSSPARIDISGEYYVTGYFEQS